ncbi:MAG: glutaredoxin [Epulopiscium sp.]|nr:glutaredoxin [Candidatus Epulonipiscium sp.]
MKIIMYGAEICPDCVKAKAQLEKASNIELDYRNITKNTMLLKEFLAYRDHEEIFVPIKEKGKIGIPFFILEDGTKTFEIENYIDIKVFDEESGVNACSIDGKGNC